MKRIIYLLLAAMLVSSCGAAPHADLLGESRMTAGSEEERGGSEMAQYLVGGAIVVVALCTVVPGARRVCQKQFMSAEGFKKGLQKRIDELSELKKGDGVDADKNDAKIKKLEEMITNTDKDGIVFTVYDATIGKLVRKIKKGGDEVGEQADDTGKKADDTGKKADDAGKKADDTGKKADDAGEQGDNK